MTLPKRIAIVEDEAITQRYLKDILNQYDVELIECYDNAKDAINGIRKEKFELILMDINIKGSMDGIQLSREIIQNKDIPIVFITAHSDKETFDEILEVSPYGFISKPFSAKDVEMTLQLAYKMHQSQSNVIQAKKEKMPAGKVVINDTYTYSRADSTLYKNNEPIKLNIKHQRLMQILGKTPNKTVKQDELMLFIWEDTVTADSALRTLVYSLRKAHPDLPIVSYSKVGYALEIE